MATRLVEAHRPFYEGTDLMALARTGRSLAEHVGALNDFTRLHQESLEATQALADARSAIVNGLQDIVEVNLQGFLQTALALLLDLSILPGSVLCGPAAPVCAVSTVLAGAAADLAIDDALGTNPQGAAEGLLGKVGAASTAKSAAEAAFDAAKRMRKPAAVGKFIPGLGQALTAMDCFGEAMEAHRAILSGIADAFGAVEDLQRIGEEAKQLRDTSLASVFIDLDDLPGEIQLASAFANCAAAENADIEREHGVDLYSPA